jgi:iron only hydrogenase large subunit
MTLAVPGTTPLSLSSRAPSIVVVGADTILRALPATPVQLAHACMQVGFQHVVPASWGDELVASASLRVMQQRSRTPAVQCSCPLVAHRLLSVGTDLRPFLVSLVSPPVAIARYLRALYGGAHLHITYVGRCPGANDESIDARMAPEDLFGLFRDHDVAVDDQPLVFDSVIPPDRRRYESLPGGVPSVDALWSSGGGRSLVEIVGDELSIELAQLLLSEAPILVDAAPALGCVCSGRTLDYDVAEGRALLASLEPPRSATPIIDTRVAVALEVPLQSPTTEPARPTAASAVAGSVAPVRGGGGTYVRHVVPPPALPYHSELEPPHESEPVIPAVPMTSARAPDDADASFDAAPAREEEAEAMAAGISALEPEPLAAHAEPATIETLPVATVLPADSEENAEPSPITSSVATYKSPRRRTPVHGIARIAQGEIPKARSAEGRPLPRAYASHRRQSVLGVRVPDVVDLQSTHAPIDATSSTQADTGRDGLASMVAPLVALPGETIDLNEREELVTATTITEPLGSPTATSGAPSMTTGTMSAVAEISELPRSSTRPVEVPRAPESERPVQLPLERLSDRPTNARKREAPAAVASRPETKEPPRAPTRSWSMLLLIVALVALLSSAAGMAIGAWYMSHRSAPTANP